MEPDVYDKAAAQLAADLHAEPPEVQEALRYLYARVALDWGLLELLGHELRESGERLVCREPNTGSLYSLDRPRAWSVLEERIPIRGCVFSLAGYAFPYRGSVNFQNF